MAAFCITIEVLGCAAGGNLPTVLANDTLNGVAVVPADITLTPGTLAPVPAAGSITMDSATGIITVAAGTTAGTYSYPYEICENLNPTNCDTATATVVVAAATIDAVDDTASGVNGLTGATAVLNVLDNDTLPLVSAGDLYPKIASRGLRPEAEHFLQLATQPSLLTLPFELRLRIGPPGIFDFRHLTGEVDVEKFSSGILLRL